MSPDLRGRRTRNARSTTGARKRTGGGRANWPTIIRERRPVYAAAERVARPARRPASTARISTAGVAVGRTGGYGGGGLRGVVCNMGAGAAGHVEDREEDGGGACAVAHGIE